MNDSSRKRLFTVPTVHVDSDESRLTPTGNATDTEVTPVNGGPAADITDDVTGADDDSYSDLPDGDVVPIDSCVAAVGVAMTSHIVASPYHVRRQSVMVRLSRLRHEIGDGLHSADGVRVPIWLSVLLVVVYIAGGAVLFSAGESVAVTSESFPCCACRVATVIIIILIIIPKTIFMVLSIIMT